jgi:oligoribonuclease NrnB/cAMP/cGMP phosphodiesterase (DHH superfamily)
MHTEEIQEQTMSTEILFHGPRCPDGFASAWAAWKALGDNAKYTPINYGDPVPSLEGVDTLYILDFSFKRSTLLELVSPTLGRIVVLDHHKTAKEELVGLHGGNLFIEFDMDKSGAMMSWEYFHPRHEPPLLIRYVQDRDLWQWKLPNSREISAYIDLQPRTFEAWQALEQMLENDDGYVRALEIGSSILSFTDEKVRSLAAKAEQTVIMGYEIHMVNSPLFQSEIGEAINKLYPEENFSVVYFIKEGKQIFSLRSKGKPGQDGFDCSSVAKVFGGGGHPGAAGFSTKFLPGAE